MSIKSLIHSLVASHSDELLKKNEVASILDGNTNVINTARAQIINGEHSASSSKTLLLSALESFPVATHTVAYAMLLSCQSEAVPERCFGAFAAAVRSLVELANKSFIPLVSNEGAQFYCEISLL